MSNVTARWNLREMHKISPIDDRRFVQSFSVWRQIMCLYLCCTFIHNTINPFKDEAQTALFKDPSYRAVNTFHHGYKKPIS